MQYCDGLPRQGAYGSTKKSKSRSKAHRGSTTRCFRQQQHEGEREEQENNEKTEKQNQSYCVLPALPSALTS